MEPMRALAEAVLALYDAATATELLVEAIESEDPRRALMKLANRIIARDHGLAAASGVLRTAALVLDAA